MFESRIETRKGKVKDILDKYIEIFNLAGFVFLDERNMELLIVWALLNNEKNVANIYYVESDNEILNYEAVSVFHPMQSFGSYHNLLGEL